MLSMQSKLYLACLTKTGRQGIDKERRKGKIKEEEKQFLVA